MTPIWVICSAPRSSGVYPFQHEIPCWIEATEAAQAAITEEKTNEPADEAEGSEATVCVHQYQITTAWRRRCRHEGLKEGYRHDRRSAETTEKTLPVVAVSLSWRYPSESIDNEIPMA